MFSCQIKKRSLVLVLSIECLSWVDPFVQFAQGPLLSGIECPASWEPFTPWPQDSWWPLICGMFGKIYIGFKWETVLNCCLSNWFKLFTSGSRCATLERSPASPTTGWVWRLPAGTGLSSALVIGSWHLPEGKYWLKKSRWWYFSLKKNTYWSFPKQINSCVRFNLSIFHRNCLGATLKA